MPMYLTNRLDNEHVSTIKQKVKALAVLTSHGLSSPPPPSEFMAPQMPGARKLHMPRISALNHVEWYHFTPGSALACLKSEGGLPAREIVHPSR